MGQTRFVLKSILGRASLIHLAGNRPGISDGAQVSELVWVDHRADRLDLGARATSCGNSRRPTAPVPPATNTRMTITLQIQESVSEIRDETTRPPVT